MKIKIRYIMLLLALLVGGGSCNNFLDVNPKGEVKAGDMFKDAKGFENALYGVYASLGKTNLYGRNLGYYALDMMAQHFVSSGNTTVEPLWQYDYTNTTAEDRFYNIWCDMYTNISNTNNVIEHLEKYSSSDMEFYDIYKGEALGLRAFMHFDLLRIFSEQITLNENAEGIPYNTRFSLKVPDVLKAKDVYRHIISDLRAAEKLLDNRTLYESASPNVNFLKDQRIHFNLQAVQATLARVYLTKGVADSALYYAQRVIEAPEYSLLDFTQITGDLQGKLSEKETLFGIYSKSYCDNVISDLHNSISFYSFKMRYDAQQTYQDAGGGNDYRWGAWFSYNATTKEWKLDKFTDYYIVNSTEYLRPTTDIRGVNLIRIPEMYYIAAEALLKQGKHDQALVYFNEVIESRGVVALDQRSPVEALTLDKISNERYKELIGEGQSFFNMKRLNLDVLNIEGATIPASNKIYVVDIPSQEFEYRN